MLEWPAQSFNVTVAPAMGEPVAAMPVTDVAGAPVTVRVTDGLVTVPDAAVTWVVPADNPVARPVVLMVATAFALLAQVKLRPEITLPFESLAVAVNCCVAKTAMDGDDGLTTTLATGGGVTVNVMGLLVTLPEAAVILVVPVETPVARPVLEMVATALVLLAQVKVRPEMMLPFASLAVAVNCCVA